LFYFISIIRRESDFTVDDKGIIPIQKKFMQNNYLFALEFREGFIFGRVVRRRICQYKPWPLIDANGNAVDIAASSHQAELRFRDPRNTSNTILYLDDSKSKAGYPWFFYGAFGIKPQWIKMYLRFPETQDLPGKFPELDPYSPSSGDDLGYIDSLRSPYEEPTDYVECVIPPHVHIGAEYYNRDDDESHQPNINILFCLYQFEVLKPEPHGTLIRRIAAREVPADFLTVGWADFPLDYGETLGDDWKVAPIKLDQALALGGGRRY